jgi:hypothetical protein
VTDAPLLDKATYLPQLTRAFANPPGLSRNVENGSAPVESGPVVGFYRAYLDRFPDGYRVVLQRALAAPDGYIWRGGKDRRSIAAKSAARSHTELERFVRYWQLRELWTCTFDDRSLAGYGPSDLTKLLKLFMQRVSRRVDAVSGPYVVVEEWGTESGRWHLHIGADWGARFDAVEVCDRCAGDSLRAVRWDIPDASRVCIGCLWGFGFVGRPVVGSANAADGGRSGVLSAYLSKYLGKDLFVSDGHGGEVRLVDEVAVENSLFRRDRYRVSKGFALPPRLEFEAESVEECVRQLVDLCPGAAEWDWWDSAAQDLDTPHTLVGNAVLEGTM